MGELVRILNCFTTSAVLQQIQNPLSRTKKSDERCIKSERQKERILKLLLLAFLCLVAHLCVPILSTTTLLELDGHPSYLLFRSLCLAFARYRVRCPPTYRYGRSAAAAAQSNSAAAAAHSESVFVSSSRGLLFVCRGAGPSPGRVSRPGCATETASRTARTASD